MLELECFASAELRDVVFLWEQREWPIGLCDQCPCLRDKETKRLAKKGVGGLGGWGEALTLYTGLVSRVLEEMGFLKLTSRNSKNIVS